MYPMQHIIVGVTLFLCLIHVGVLSLRLVASSISSRVCRWRLYRAEQVTRTHVRRFDLFAVSKKSKSSSKLSEFGLKPPSLEQIDIVNAVIQGDWNIQVNAVAGSGKTTTLLHIASALQNTSKSVIALTYNRKLKDETRDKSVLLGLDNCLEVQTFHALGVKYYGAVDASRDVGLQRIVQSNLKPVKPMHFDLLVLDEAQDLTPTLFAFICKVLHDNQQSFSIMAMGDDRQNIYQFQKADHRYFTMSDQSFGPFNSKRWKRMELRCSYRLTDNIAAFMNFNVLHTKHFATSKPSPYKVRYYEGNVYRSVDSIFKHLADLLRDRMYEPKDIFLLIPTLSKTSKKETPFNRLANSLADLGYPFYVPPGDDSKVDLDLAGDKIICSTYHGSKGLERKVVVVFGFSNSYYEFFGKDLDRTFCANTFYVALTRASELLLIVGDEPTKRLTFLKNMVDSSYLQVIQNGVEEDGERTFLANKRTVAVVKLLRFRQDRTISDAMSFIKVRRISEPYANVDLPHAIIISPPTAADSGAAEIMEEVATLNGLAIPSMYERRTTGICTIQMSSIEYLTYNRDKYANQTMLELMLKTSNRKYAHDDMDGHLELAAVYSYISTGFNNKFQQIRQYDWIRPEEARKALDILDAQLKQLKGEVQEYEFLASVVDKDTLPPYSLTVDGRIDLLTSNSIIEIKCTKALETDHILQLALYGYIWYSKKFQNGYLKHGDRALVLSNIRTGEMLEITSTPAELEQAALILIESYLRSNSTLISNELFLQETDELSRKWHPGNAESLEYGVNIGKAKSKSKVKAKTKAKSKSKSKSKPKTTVVEDMSVVETVLRR